MLGRMIGTVDDGTRGAAGTPSAAQDLGVVVVHHRAPRAVLDEAMPRLARAAPGARVVLVATGGAVPAPGPGWPRVRAIEVENHSYARAVNRGLAALAPLPYLALMNDDVLVEERTFADLLAALAADPGAGAAGPLAYDGTGRPQDMGPVYRRAQRRVERAAATAGTSPAPAVPVPWLAGCLKLVTRQAFVATGGYDEGFRFTNEDLDHGLRSAALGYRNLLVGTPVVHLGGTSTPAHPAFHVEGRRGGYLVTARHLLRPARWLHRAFLLAEGSLGSLLARDAATRAAHRSVARMALSGAWAEGPFGPTLDDR